MLPKQPTSRNVIWTVATLEFVLVTRHMISVVKTHRRSLVRLERTDETREPLFVRSILSKTQVFSHPQCLSKWMKIKNTKVFYQ